MWYNKQLATSFCRLSMLIRNRLIPHFDTLLKKAFSWAVANVSSWVTPLKKVIGESGGAEGTRS
jgi:hypothetical protein